jgi:hypothetical protein
MKAEISKAKEKGRMTKSEGRRRRAVRSAAVTSDQWPKRWLLVVAISLAFGFWALEFFSMT